MWSSEGPSLLKMVKTEIQNSVPAAVKGTFLRTMIYQQIFKSSASLTFIPWLEGSPKID